MISRTQRLQEFRILAVAIALIVGIFAAGIPENPAHAHDLGGYYWQRGGTQTVIQSYIFGSTTGEAEAARLDAWNRIPILYNYRVDYHTDVSVFDGNFGDTGWYGYATFESVSGYVVLHGHARVNTYYYLSSWAIQGVYCQEVFHVYGFDHNNTGGCMGLYYYSGSSNVLSSHDLWDFDSFYRYNV